MPNHSKRWHHVEEGNSVQCLDFNPDGRRFATAGKDRIIRIYDEQTKVLQQQIAPAEENHRGHSNRLFCVKFPDENMLVTGGWDAVVHIWDLRSGKSAQYLLGPHISGDAIDVQKNLVLTGSHNHKDPLQLWDLHMGKLLQNLEWSGFKEETPRIFTAKFR